jgi:hypothetical protein
LKLARSAFLFILVTSLVLALPNVQAQTTTITNLRHPVHAVAGSLDPIIVTATVSYHGANPNYTLNVGILDMDRNDTLAPGIAISGPDHCVNQPVLLAYCVMKLAAASGSESLEFRIGGILTDFVHVPGTWNLNITAALFDLNRNLFQGSISSIPFGITLTPITLTIQVPSTVNVTVDNVTMPAGAITIPVIAGQHKISLPEIAPVNEMTRIRFDHWADGVNESSRTISIVTDTSYQALYTTQYRLAIAGDQGMATGAGWYDQGSTASFTVPAVASATGILGTLGAKLNFQGWYENGTLITTETSGSIAMDQPHTITAVWQVDYTMPLIVIGIVIVVVAAVLGIGYFTSRKGSKKQKSRTRSK